MKYTIELELPDNDTVIKEIKTADIYWSVWGYSGLSKAKPNEQRWIPVSERLPEDGERVLAITKSGNQFVGFHTQFSGWHFEHVIHPTHWMPLPEPPQMD